MDSAIRFAKGEALIDQQLIETQIIGEFLKPPRKPSTCSNCKELGNNRKQCRVDNAPQ